MNNSAKKITMTILAFIALTANFSVSASTNSEARHVSSGVIRFTGSIVAPPCVTETNGHNIETKCWNDKGVEKTASFDVNKLQGREIKLPNLKGTQKVSWLNEQKTLGIYTIAYD